MNPLELVFAAVASGNVKKEELNQKHEKYLKVFREEGLEREYQAYVNAGHEQEQLLRKMKVK